MHVYSHKWYRPQIDKRKLRELSKRRNIPGLIHFFNGLIIILAILGHRFHGTRIR